MNETFKIILGIVLFFIVLNVGLLLIGFISQPDNIFEVITEKEDFYKVKLELEKKIDAFEHSSIEWRPLNYIELDQDQINSATEVLTSLEDLDDVQNIFTNANLKNLQ